MYHSRIVLSVGGSVWYVIRNLRCTVTIDSVLANCKTQNAFLFTVNAIFRHDYPLAVEPGRTPGPLVQKKRPLVQKKLGEILYLLICSFLPCLSWMLRSRVRKSRRDLWITLYIRARVLSYESWESSTTKRKTNQLHSQAHYHCRRCDSRFKMSNVTAINNCALTLKANYRILIIWLNPLAPELDI